MIMEIVLLLINVSIYLRSSIQFVGRIMLKLRLISVDEFRTFRTKLISEIILHFSSKNYGPFLLKDVPSIFEKKIVLYDHGLFCRYFIRLNFEMK